MRPEEQVSGTLRLSSSCTERRRIKFLGSALRDCSPSSPQVVRLLPLPEAIAADSFTGFYIVLRSVLVNVVSTESAQLPTDRQAAFATDHIAGYF
ncbi:hypothetical protein U9M48_011944 [Paspalum notatum var. saurae]|uniref:Uncharacterized protein n=1 Tax=Paspalum notatum var. saurae TaxID=547442 RepID=A0AAQ3SWY1_PASNO